MPASADHFRDRAGVGADDGNFAGLRLNNDPAKLFFPARRRTRRQGKRIQGIHDGRKFFHGTFRQEPHPVCQTGLAQYTLLQPCQERAVADKQQVESAGSAARASTMSVQPFFFDHAPDIPGDKAGQAQRFPAFVTV